MLYEYAAARALDVVFYYAQRNTRRGTTMLVEHPNVTLW